MAVNKLKRLGAGTFAGGALTNNDWILILSIIIMVLGMVQSYLENRE